MREWFRATSKVHPAAKWLEAEWTEDGVNIRMLREVPLLMEVALMHFDRDFDDSVPGWNPHGCALPTWRPPAAQARGTIEWFRCLAMDFMNFCDVEYGYEP